MRRRTWLVSSLVLVVGLSVQPAALASDADTFYLTSEGHPHSGLSVTPPRPGDLPNFDPGRDIHPGLLVIRSSTGLQVSDPDRYQHWQTGTSGYQLRGVPTLVLWAAVSDFDHSKVGSFKAYLLDCPEWGEDCLAISVASHSFQARPTDAWVENKVSFPEVDYEIEPGRALAIRIVVPEYSDDDLWFAYDRHEYRSRLFFASRPLGAVGSDVAPADEVASAAQAGEVSETTAAIQPGAVDETAEGGLGPVAAYLITLAVSTLVLGGLALYLLSTLHGERRILRAFPSGSGSRFITALQSRTRRVAR